MSEQESVAAKAASEAEAEAPKRRRGRPRKADVEAAQAAAEQDDAQGTASSKKAAAKKTASAKKTAAAKKADAEKKPAAKKAAKAKATKAAAEEQAEAGSEKAEADEAPKPRRGRPRKASAAAEDAVPEAAKESAAAGDASPAAADSASASDSASSDKDSAAGAAQKEGSNDSAQDSGSEETAERSGHRTKRVRQDKQSGNNANHGNGRNNAANNNGKHDRGDSQDRNRRNRRNKHDNRNNNRYNAPQVQREDLEALKVAELRAKAEELGVEHKGLLKAALVDAVYEAAVRAEGFVNVEGILDVMPDGYGFLRTNGYLPGPNDAYVGAAVIRRNGLRKGDKVAGQTRPARPNDKFAALHRIDSVNGLPLEILAKRPRFADMTPIFPDERLVMEHGRSTITARVIDLCAPIGKGQRGLIVSPPKAGKTTILKDIAASIAANNPEVHLMCLLVDERPEEVTDMERSIHGEVMASTFDQPSENHIALAEMVIERAKRLVEMGEDVVILLDSITRLARAYNLAQPASGRILSGGVDSTALYPPKRFLGAARNIEGGGSLTILASALIETGSKMDEVIFEEFKGTGNMEVKLDRQLADRRIFPAIDAVASGTRREDLLLDPQEAPLIWAVRRILANRNNTERAMEMLIKSLRQTNNNQEFLIRAAKKAQSRVAAEDMDF